METLRNEIDKKIDAFAERYKNGEDLWTGVSLCNAADVETKFRPALERDGGFTEDEKPKTEPEPVEEREEILETMDD